MKVLFTLAFRNIYGAGLRTWLNVGTLSFGFVFIVWMQGLMDGMVRQIESAQIDAEYGGGQYWHKEYDPLNPLTLEKSYGVVGRNLQTVIQKGQAAPLLLMTGFIYPKNRGQSVIVRGINPQQKVIVIPSYFLVQNNNKIPALIGSRMAQRTGLKKGDTVTLRWRNTNGVFDTADIQIAHIMRIVVPSLDAGQVWLPLKSLQTMIKKPHATTLVVVQKGYDLDVQDSLFHFKNQEFLLQDERKMFQQKEASNYILYLFLMGMGLLAVFDTQVLAIFRRRKEIGTLMALGMNRWQVVKLFTLEGSFHGLLALLAGAVWGIPLMAFTSIKGLPMPQMADSYGLAIGARIYTFYIPSVLIGSLLILILSVIIVSFLPSRKIASMKITHAIRGKS